MTDIECYYFGILQNSVGFQLYARNNIMHNNHLPDDFPVKIGTLDGGLLPPNLSQEQGRAELIHFKDWTILTFWDRSADKRGNSSSAFIIRGIVNFLEAVNIAKENCPQIWSRFTFEVFERITDG